MPESLGIEPGGAAPDFHLPNANTAVGGDSMSLTDVMSHNGAIVVFTCNHCPYVVGSEPRIEAMAERARSEGLGFAGINSNDPVNYESDSWGNMVKRANRGMSTPTCMMTAKIPRARTERRGHQSSTSSTHLVPSSTAGDWMTPQETPPIRLLPTYPMRWTTSPPDAASPSRVPTASAARSSGSTD